MNSTTQIQKSQNEVSAYPIPICVIYLNGDKTKQQRTEEKI